MKYEVFVEDATGVKVLEFILQEPAFGALVGFLKNEPGATEVPLSAEELKKQSDASIKLDAEQEAWIEDNKSPVQKSKDKQVGEVKEEHKSATFKHSESKLKKAKPAPVVYDDEE